MSVSPVSALSLHAFAEISGSARRLAALLGVPCEEVSVHRFPDGESLVRVATPLEAGGTAILYRSLDHPNAKLVELLLAAAALRDNGAARVVLVAPYLGYMRQDIAFHPGEAVSQRVIGGLLARHFDAVLTVDPHLHRIATLEEAIPGIAAISLTAAPVLAEAIDAADKPVLVGPDSESRQWVEAIAAPLGLDVLVGEKERSGDRAVAMRIDGIKAVRGRRAILVDDVISSGTTLLVAAGLLREAGATCIEALATHCLADAETLATLRKGGIEQVQATDCVPGPVSTLPVAPLLVEALRACGP